MTRISKKKNSTSSQFSSSKPFLSTNPLMLLLEFQKVDFTSNIPRPVYTSQESPASSPKHSQMMSEEPKQLVVMRQLFEIDKKYLK